MRVVSQSIYNFLYIFILLLLFGFIYSLLGIQLYGGKFAAIKDTDDNPIR